MRHQMQALTQAIAASTQARQEALAACKAQTADMMSTFNPERAAPTKELKASLLANCMDRSQVVSGLLADAAAERAAFANEFQSAARSQAKELMQDRRERCAQVDGMMHDFYTSRMESSQELSGKLTECLQKIRTSVAGLSVWRGV